MMLRERREPVEEITVADRGELLRGLGAIALRDAGDDVFLGAEVAIEIARAHPGFGADLLHRGLMKARTGKAGLRRFEDLPSAVGLQLSISSTHEIVPRNKIKRTFILKMRKKLGRSRVGMSRQAADGH